MSDQNHWIGIAGLVIGIVLSAYFYFAAKLSGDIALDFKTVKIVQSGMPILKIFDDKNQAIASDVFGLEVIVWNDGSFSLGEKSDRVRRPLTIILDPGVRIIGAQLQATGKSATQTEMVVSPRVIQESVEVTWREFDPGDAFKLLILYSAKKQSSISTSARIIDTNFQIISEPKEVDPSIPVASFSIDSFSHEYSKFSFNIKYHFAKTMMLAIAIVTLVAVMLLTMFSTTWAPKERRERLKPYVLALMIISQAAIVASTFWPSATVPI
ncbi:MAG TPA: hypothetical protein VK522_22480 [Pseudolabrys sp.]|nr:hypothetical protein [Pseudolabrys sp.]